MHRSNLAELPCSLARTLQIVGEWWTLLVLRDICFGVNRFEQIHDHLGVARNILTARLDTLLEAEMIERQLYQDRPAMGCAHIGRERTSITDPASQRGNHLQESETPWVA